MKHNDHNLPSMLLAVCLLAPLRLSAATVSYEYDALDRLTQVSYAEGTIIQYSYDPAGNRTQKIVSNPTDADSDGVADAVDNCPSAFNPDQADLDGDGLGDACDRDIDGDRMPNDFETFYGFDPRDPSDANADKDGDGYTNLQEYLAGTDPADRNDRPRSKESVLAIIQMLLGD